MGRLGRDDREEEGEDIRSEEGGNIGEEEIRSDDGMND
jgi:hypothetical protein